MQKGLYCVRYEIEDRSNDLLFLTDNYQDAKKFYHKKVKELKNNPKLDFAFTHKNDYLGDFVMGTTFTDDDFLSYDVRFSNEMWYDNGLLYHGDGTAEEMTEEDLLKTLENYRKVV